MAAPTLADAVIAIRRLQARINATQDRLLDGMTQLLSRMDQRAPSITEEIDQIPGRRMFYNLSGTIGFTAAQRFTVGPPVTLTVSQDGPFVMTHYPMVLWKPTAPSTASNFGRWRPVTTFPLPLQVVDEDIIDLSYQMQDGGTGRMLQSAPAGPIFSRPDNLIPLPVPTIFSAAAVIAFIPTYNQITWNSADVPTAGELQVDLPGYRVVNL